MSRLFVIQPSAFTERAVPYPILADEESGAEYDPGDGMVAEVYLEKATQRIVERLAAAGLLNAAETEEER